MERKSLQFFSRSARSDFCHFTMMRKKIFGVEYFWKASIVSSCILCVVFSFTFLSFSAVGIRWLGVVVKGWLKKKSRWKGENNPISGRMDERKCEIRRKSVVVALITPNRATTYVRRKIIRTREEEQKKKMKRTPSESRPHRRPKRASRRQARLEELNG